MARPDQWLKQVLAHETPLVTRQGATFERAPEIATTELPLQEELIPFLVARTGKPLKEFVRRVHGRREPAWFAKMVYSLPEVAKRIQAVEPDLTPRSRTR